MSSLGDRIRGVPPVHAPVRMPGDQERLDAGTQLVYALYHLHGEELQHLLRLLDSRGFRVAYDRAVKAYGIQHGEGG